MTGGRAMDEINRINALRAELEKEGITGEIID